jgi:hypothetical protein
MLFLSVVPAAVAHAQRVDSARKLRGTVSVDAGKLLQKSYRTEVDLMMRSRGERVEVTFAFKGHTCVFTGTRKKERVELDPEQTCAVKFSDSGYDVDFVAKLTQPELRFIDKKLHLSARYSAEGFVVHDVKVWTLVQRVAIPVAGGGKIELSETVEG